jgi:hypothetical protein
MFGNFGNLSGPVLIAIYGRRFQNARDFRDIAPGCEYTVTKPGYRTQIGEVLTKSFGIPASRPKFRGRAALPRPFREVRK